jgi:hypothetical protein
VIGAGGLGRAPILAAKEGVDQRLQDHPASRASTFRTAGRAIMRA